MSERKLNKLWINGKAILEGAHNAIFKSEHVEEIAAERKAICDTWPDLDLKGSACLVPGTQPCCAKCGCSLHLKLRSLSSACGDEENPRWHALLSQEEEDALTNEIKKPNQDGNNIQSRDA